METIKQIPSIFAFVKVAQFASFSKAAEHTGVSKSHLSKLVKELEIELKKTLFIRTTRSVEFTEFGKYFYQVCKGHMFEIEKITRQTQEISQVPRGQIRITLAGAYGEESVSPLIAKLLTRYPGISTELIFSERVLDLKKEKIDLAIRVSSKKPRDGHALKIGERQELLCASETFLRTYGTPQTPGDLQKFNCLLGSSDSWTLKNKTRSYKINVNGNFRSSNGRSLAHAALAGLGIAKLPEVYVQKYIENKQLAPVLQEFTTSPVPIWAITPFQKEVPKIVRLVIKELH